VARMRHAPRALVAGGLVLAVSLIAACGSQSGLLSSSQANTLLAQLQQVNADLGRHDCVAASNDLGAVASQIQNLPDSVSSTLRQNLNTGVQTAQTLLARQCGSGTTSTATNTSSTTTSTQTSTATTATQTTTTPTTQTATTPTPTGTSTTGPGSGGVGVGGNNGQGNGGSPGNGNGH
jgi:hypothetical protein